jgi:hypothetical protein
MSFLKSIVHAAGKAVGVPTHAALSVALFPEKELAKGAERVPGIGKPLSSVIRLGSAPMRLADSISQGDRVDRATIATLRAEARNVKEVAPYAQMVLSVVPGVGTVAAGAIGAGIALAEGQPITAAIAAGVRGAVPGGPVALSLYDAGNAALHGKPLAQIGIAALPVDPNVKASVGNVLKLAADVSHGKKVPPEQLHAAEKGLPPEVRSPLAVGLAMAEAEDTQRKIIADVGPGQLNSLSEKGLSVIAPPTGSNRPSTIDHRQSYRASMVAGHQLVSSEEGRKGYRVGTGLMQYKVKPIEAIAVRNHLTNAQQEGFDLAAAGHVGLVNHERVHDVENPHARFGYAATIGSFYAPTRSKQMVVDSTSKHPQAKAGMIMGAKEIATASKGSWWHRLLVWLGIEK